MSNISEWMVEAHEWFDLIEQFGDWLDDEQIEAIMVTSKE